MHRGLFAYPMRPRHAQETFLADRIPQTHICMPARIEGKASTTYTIKPKKVSGFKVSKAKKAFKAKWSKNKTERSGVQVKYSTKKSMKNAKTIKAKGASVKAKTVKKLKKETKYYVQVRSYKIVGGKTYYSNWSAKKAVKTR